MIYCKSLYEQQKFRRLKATSQSVILSRCAWVVAIKGIDNVSPTKDRTVTMPDPRQGQDRR